MIDDQARNIEGAKAAGLHTHFFEADGLEALRERLTAEGALGWGKSVNVRVQRADNPSSWRSERGHARARQRETSKRGGRQATRRRKVSTT